MKPTHYIFAAVLLIAIILGAGINRSFHKCPKCPEIVTRSHIERDSIIIHDTVKVVKYSQSITVKTEPQADTTIPKMVTYGVVDTMQDQAVIGFSMASIELPSKRPPDLTHTAWYVAKPDHIKIISDTLTVQLPPLKCSSRFWREVGIGGICFSMGVIGATTYFLLK